MLEHLQINIKKLHVLLNITNLCKFISKMVAISKKQYFLHFNKRILKQREREKKRRNLTKFKVLAFLQDDKNFRNKISQTSLLYH